MDAKFIVRLPAHGVPALDRGTWPQTMDEHGQGWGQLRRWANPFTIPN